jgi:hypothetical protein
MGWNTGYTIMESQVVSLYDKGVLNKDVLNAIMEPFRDSDIDSGGSMELKAKDGKSADNIICFIMEPEKYNEAIKDFVPDPEEPDWNEKLYDLCEEITRREWNFFY